MDASDEPTSTLVHSECRRDESLHKPASSGDPVSHSPSLARIALNMSWPDGSDRINLSANVIAAPTPPVATEPVGPPARRLELTVGIAG
jgi:hypothetical protein